MKQILHILKKDVRHFWLEIAVALILVALLALLDPGVWRDSLSTGAFNEINIPARLATLEIFLTLLIPASWWLLIARVVQEERLVGDRQFWITRPYEWQKLLAAKVLLVAGFIYLPLALAQCWLLQVAGLRPAQHGGALLIDWLKIAAFPILPLAAIAAVTRNFARMTLTLLALVVAAALMVTLGVAMIQSGSLHPPVSTIDAFDFPLLLAGSAAAILLAYAARKIALARIVLLAVPLLLLLISFVFSTDATVDRAYPGNVSAGIHFGLNDDPNQASSVHPGISQRVLRVDIPLKVTGVASGDHWSGEGVRVAIQSQGRTVWQSPWQQMTFPVMSGKYAFLAIDINRDVFYRVQSEPVTLQVELALDQARARQPANFRVSFHDIEVPELGVCSTVIDPQRLDLIDGKRTPQIVGMSCRSAMRDPKLTFVETAFTYGPCQSSPGSEVSNLSTRSAWVGNLDDEAAKLGIVPVKLNSIPFGTSSWARNNGPGEPGHICPGAPITFTGYSLVRRMRTEFTIDNFRFPAYDEREDPQH